MRPDCSVLAMCCAPETPRPEVPRCDVQMCHNARSLITNGISPTASRSSPPNISRSSPILVAVKRQRGGDKPNDNREQQQCIGGACSIGGRRLVAVMQRATCGPQNQPCCPLHHWTMAQRHQRLSRRPWSQVISTPRPSASPAAVQYRTETTGERVFDLHVPVPQAALQFIMLL